MTRDTQMKLFLGYKSYRLKKNISDYEGKERKNKRKKKFSYSGN